MSSIDRPTIGSVPGIPALQNISIRSVDGRHVLTEMAGPEPAEIVGGRGGWEEVTRNRKTSIIQWVGSGLRSSTVTMMFDGWATDTSVEPALKLVDALAPPAPTSETPVVTVWGVEGIPSTVQWVIQGVTPSERLRRDTDGATVRVQVAFDLLEYRPGDVVVVKSDPAKRSVERNGTPARVKPKTYTVRKGDTLAKIAAKQLGSAAKWQTLAKLNGIKNPNNLKVGAVLKLP